MKKSNIFSAVIAFILLFLYAGTLAYMIKEVVEWDKVNPVTFSDGLVIIVTIIGGLVSALVVAKLALAKPGENPGINKNRTREDGTPDKLNQGLAWLYLSIWLIVGLSAVIIGVMIYPKANQTINDIGTAWLGIAAAAGYAYFGLNPKG